MSKTYSEKFKDYILIQSANTLIESTKYKFPNGYVASVIYGEYTYALEIAICIFNNGDFKICYDTPLTKDVIGYVEDLDKELQEIYELPKRKEAHFYD